MCRRRSLPNEAEGTTAHFACERLFASMCADVRCEVIRSREVPHTDSALEGLLSGMCSHVTRQLVRTREPTGAVLHGARIWAFAGRHFGLLGGVVAFLLENAESGTVDGPRVDGLERVGTAHVARLEFLRLLEGRVLGASGPLGRRLC